MNVTELKRFNHYCNGDDMSYSYMDEDSCGDYVRYEDVLALFPAYATELAQLKADKALELELQHIREAAEEAARKATENYTKQKMARYRK